VVKSGSAEPSIRSRRVGRLLAALAGAGLTLALLLIRGRTETDFDLLWYSARHFLHGVDPYPRWHEHWKYPLYYPFTAVLVAVPFAALPLVVARVVFNASVGAVLGACFYGREHWRWWTFASGAYYFATLRAQPTPLLLAAVLIPMVAGILVIKPNTGLTLFLAYPSRRAVLQGVALLTVSVILLPRWPLEWLQAIRDSPVVISPVRRPFGWLLLLALLRWRDPRARLVAALAVVPQNSFPHEAIVLCLVPQNGIEMAIFCVGTWIATVVTLVAHTTEHQLEAAQSMVWPWLLGFVYLPALWLVLRRPTLGLSPARHREE
jgi:hypothetical protein